MSLTVQDDSGCVWTANAYLTVAAFKAYHQDRGNCIGSATDSQIAAAIVRATDYLDGRFRYRGKKFIINQTTEWPRAWCYDNSHFAVIGVPLAVKSATAEYTLRALGKDLNPDPLRDASGRLATSVTKTVKGLSLAKTYADQGLGSLPEYPAADLILMRAGLVVSRVHSRDVRVA